MHLLFQHMHPFTYLKLILWGPLLLQIHIIHTRPNRTYSWIPHIRKTFTRIIVVHYNFFYKWTLIINILVSLTHEIIYLILSYLNFHMWKAMEEIASREVKSTRFLLNIPISIFFLFTCMLGSLINTFFQVLGIPNACAKLFCHS